MSGLDFKYPSLNYHKDVLISSMVRGGIWLGLECADAYFNPIERQQLWKKPLYISACFGIDVIMCAISGTMNVIYDKSKDCNYSCGTGVENNVENWRSVVLNDAVVNPFAVMWIGTAIGLKGTGTAIAPQLPLVAIPNPLNIVGQGVDMVLPNIPVEPMGDLVTLRNACGLYGISHNILTASNIIIKDMTRIGWTAPSLQPPPSSATPPTLNTTQTSSV
jgi:hypothetical protein